MGIRTERFTWDFTQDMQFDGQKANLKEDMLNPWEVQVILRAIEDVVDSIEALIGVENKNLESDITDSH